MITNFFQEGKMFQKTMFVYSKLYIQHPGDIISLTHAGILSSTSNLFATIALPCFEVTCDTHPPLRDLSGNTGFLQRVQKIMSVGCDWLILIHVAFFVSW